MELQALELLKRLGVEYYADRHVRNIKNFLMDEGTEVEELLDRLGSWDESDLVIAKKWLKDVKQ